MTGGKTKRGVYDYIFYLAVGGLFLYAVNTSVLRSTVIEFDAPGLYLTGLVFLTLFMGVFFNKITMLVSGAVVLLTALYIWATWENRAEQNEIFGELLLLARGMALYKEAYAPYAINAISGALAFFTAVFMFGRFNFYVLALGGSSTFALSWLMDYRRDEASFVIFLFCFCMLLIKQMNLHRKREDFSSLSALLALPFCFAAVIISGLAPNAAGSEENPMRRLFDEPLAAANDFFYEAFNPKYFSFQTTGFTDSTNELGGAVNVSDRNVMRVAAPRRIYLSGASKDSYTGRRWDNTIEQGLPTAFYNPGRFEFLETAAALIKNVSVYESLDEEEGGSMARFRARLSEDDKRYTDNGDFPMFLIKRDVYLLGRRDPFGVRYFSFLYTREEAEQAAEMTKDIMELDDDDVVIASHSDNGFVRSYLPADTVTVNVLARTGSLFKPPKSWEPDFIEDTVTTEPELTSSAVGDWQSPNLLEQNAAYSFNYLSPNTGLTFVQDALNKSYRGYYRDSPVDAEAYAPEFDWFINPVLRETYWDYSESDKSALLFNALYETYMYTDGLSVPWEDVRTYRAAGIPAGRRIGDQLHEYDFRLAVDGMNGLLAEYADEVYARYMNLPETLPRRVKDLAAELTADYETDYQKVKAIEEYLLTFPYTLTPDEVPEGADFVDYFLFEGKEGYCTYYASAMAVLARCVGVPSRYMEGYILPAERDNDGFYTVNNKNAHSWAEVYLEGYGWLSLEATAPYHGVMASQGARAAVPGGMFAYDYTQDPGYLAYLEAMGYDSSTALTALPPPAEQPDTKIFTPEFMRSLFFYSGLALFAGIIGVFVFIAVQRVRESLRLRAVGKLPVNEKAQVYFKGLVKMTDFYHYPRLEEETARMYCARLGKRFAFRSDAVFVQDLFKPYYKARYGDKPVTEEELALLMDCYNEFHDFLRYFYRLPVYIYLRFFRRVTAL